MAKVVYVDRHNGSDTNDGLTSGTAKQTISGARSATSSGDLVLIAPGVYLENYINWDTSSESNILYRRDPTKPGKVIVDFENSLGNDGYGHWTFDDSSVSFLDIHFRNPAPGIGLISVAGSQLKFFMHCVFYQRDGTVNTGYGINDRFAGGYGWVLNCTFYNLEGGFAGDIRGNHYGNYFVNVTYPIRSIGVDDYNAYPGNTEEPNGINTTTGANPGLTNPSGEDFTLDRTTTPADWTTFKTSGFDGGTIGAWGNGGFLYTPDLPQLDFLSPDPTAVAGNPQDGWENEGPSGTNTYTDGTPGDIIKNASDELEIDLGTTPTATGGRVRSPVFNLGSTSGVLRHVAYQSWEDLINGAAIDTNTTLPQQVEYRTSTTAFLKGDVSPSWLAVSQGTNINATGQQYIQYRITLRTDHTNA